MRRLPTTDKESYRAEYFEANKSIARNSARRIVPIVVDLVHPKSVLDFGCGTGSWLAVFGEFGIEDSIGIDAEWIDRRSLEIPQDHFAAIDIAKPVNLERRFDLVLALEVGEHLAPNSALTLIENLTRAGPVVLFSAAIPFSGGAHHVNEQWPEYWVEKFRARGFFPIDCIRRRVWMDSQVAWWYAQGCVLFAEARTIEQNPALKSQWESAMSWPLSLVHPANYLRVADPSNRTVGHVFWDLVNAIKRKGKKIRRV